MIGRNIDTYTAHLFRNGFYYAPRFIDFIQDACGAADKKTMTRRNDNLHFASFSLLCLCAAFLGFICSAIANARRTQDHLPNLDRNAGWGRDQYRNRLRLRRDRFRWLLRISCRPLRQHLLHVTVVAVDIARPHSLDAMRSWPINTVRELPQPVTIPIPAFLPCRGRSILAEPQSAIAEERVDTVAKGFLRRVARVDH